MEYFDVVDQNGIPTGETVERSIAHSNGVRHRSAHVWLIRCFRGRIEVLLQKRSAQKDSYPGCYDTSSAGHITAGDEPLTAARRELSEELGIYANPNKLHFIGTFPIQFKQEFHGKFFNDEEIAFVFVYPEPVDIGMLTLQAEELVEIHWFDLERLYLSIEAGDPRFCVPRESLNLLRSWLSTHPVPSDLD